MEREQQITGAEIVLKALQEQGVEHYSGGAVLPIYDAIFLQDKIERGPLLHDGFGKCFPCQCN